MTESRREQGLREKPLFDRHFLERKALARTRNEVPVPTLLVVKVERGLSLLFRRQRDQKVSGRDDHFRTSVVSANGDGDQEDKSEQSNEAHRGVSKLRRRRSVS